MSVDASVLMSTYGWVPENILTYFSNNDLCEISEIEAFEMCDRHKKCPIIEFRQATTDSGTEIIFCIIDNNCKNNVCLNPMICLYEDEVASPYLSFDDKIYYLNPIPPDSPEFVELFDEAIVAFV